jgi:three-Cys-motif partner protein
MSTRPSKRSKDDLFFEEKRAWSRVKDHILGAYLVPYLQKVKRLGSTILIIDPFAGPGKFLDGSPGSPLIITSIAERIVPGQYLAVFGNKRLRNHQKLSTLLRARIDRNLVETYHLPADDLLVQFSPRLGKHTVFLYLDPYGLPPAFVTLGPFLGRKPLSTEILVNQPPSALHRVAAVPALHQHLTRSLGSGYWRGVYENDEFSAAEKAERVIREYGSRIKKHLQFSGSCPIREREGSAVKYYMTFFSGHPDSPRLYNDVMRSAYRQGLYEAMTKGTLLEGAEPLTDNQAGEVEMLKGLILEKLRKGGSESRERLWGAIIDERFMQFGQTNYIKAVQALTDEGRIGFEDVRRTKRLNDDAVLYVKKGGTVEAAHAAKPLPTEATLAPKGHPLPDHIEVRISARLVPPTPAPLLGRRRTRPFEPVTEDK